MSGDGVPGDAGLSRRTALAAGGLLAALAASGGAFLAAKVRVAAHADLQPSAR